MIRINGLLMHEVDDTILRTESNGKSNSARIKKRCERFVSKYSQR